MSVGKKISPKFWNKTKCRARETKSFPQHPEFNSRLNDLENVVRSVFRRLVNDNGIPTPSKLKKEIINDLEQSKMKLNGSADNISFFGFIRLIIEESRNGTRLTPKGKHFSNYTVKGYITTRNHLEEFQKFKRNRIDFGSIDMDFYNELVNWFYAQGKAKNTLGKHIKNLKVFMAEAFDRGRSNIWQYNMSI